MAISLREPGGELGWGQGCYHAAALAGAAARVGAGVAAAATADLAAPACLVLVFSGSPVTASPDAAGA